MTGTGVDPAVLHLMTLPAESRKTLGAILSRCEIEGDCLIWQGPVRLTGHGITRVDGKQQHVTRVLYGLLREPLTSRDVLRPTCGRILCTRLDHIVKVEHPLLQYVADNAAKTRCPKGHPYIAGNVHYSYSRGKRRRHCVTCLADRTRAVAAARAAS